MPPHKTGLSNRYGAEVITPAESTVNVLGPLSCFAVIVPPPWVIVVTTVTAVVWLNP